MSRTNELIEAMAVKFADGQFIDRNFLIENNIKSSELGIFDTIASILRGYLKLDSTEQVAVIMAGSNIPKPVIDRFLLAGKMESIPEKIKNIFDQD